MSIANQLKTTALLALLSAVLIGIGSFWGTGGMVIGLVFALVMNGGSYWFSDKLVLKMYKAKEIKKHEAPNLYNAVHEVVLQANIPMPKLYQIPSENPNAFATGRSPKHSAIAVTQGIVKLLSKDELKGVIAHELSHIKNRDILVGSIAATIAAVISFAAMMARWGAIFGGFGGRDNDNNIVGLIAMAIIAPITATIIQLAISRSREFLADETGAKMTKNPFALASALEKLEQAGKIAPMRMGNQNTAHMFIANPFKGGLLMKLFSTHPPMKERIKRLREMRL